MSTHELIRAHGARDDEADALERKREAIAQEAETLDALFREDLRHTSTGGMLRGYLTRNARVITAFDALIDAIAEAELEGWARDADADAAALDRMAEQEPVAGRKWHDETKTWEYTDFMEYHVAPRTWTGECLYTAPATQDRQQAAMQAISDMAQEECREDDARDAARYRWLREQNNNRDTIGARIAIHEYGMDWDAAIDAAMKEPR